MKIVVTVISKNLVTNLVLSLSCPLVEKKQQCWWSGNVKYLMFIFIESRDLLQRYVELNRLL